MDREVSMGLIDVYVVTETLITIIRKFEGAYE